MEDYKSLNSELVAKVQELKIRNGEYEKEIICLKGQLLDNYAFYVIQKKKLVNIILQSMDNYRDVLKEVDPHINIAARFNHTPRESRTFSSRRRSTIILQEFRNSNAIRNSEDRLTLSPTDRLSTRRSTILPSTRYQSPLLDDHSLQSSPDPDDNCLQGTPPIESEECNKNDLLYQFEVERDESESDRLLHSITEHNEENSEFSEEIDSDSASVKNSEEINHTSQDLILKQENKEESKQSSNENIAPQFITKRNRRYINSQTSETTIQKTDFDEQTEVINSLRDLSINRSERSEYEENHCGNHDFLSTANNERFLDNFISLPSSTPRPSLLTTSTDDSQNSVSTRSQRSCKPTNLKEPGLKFKLRSENPRRASKLKTKVITKETS